ncbi:shieldin complex subunit 3 [Toxotes jaculatrix]|uniref:shieldin complex subunit 3 n=1 Tax=Toxotes jaculatrix TaxID=941984 RepID=UPI001B3AF4B1|nr:shieldin complex subunit 3 [Toxotes jaculatrix]XP_040897623.1 shieldin complex subunit 3 [Toxotes jaculatrix]XP_040897624.1 shieldin complex subunit 3 [Toxotes jaculatrix]
MEDVVLHYQSGSADGLSSLLERTEKLLEPFPCRTPPAFAPWFPTTTADRRLPIRPAKPAPVITSSSDVLISDNRPHPHTTVTESLPKNKLQRPKAEKCYDAETTRSPPEKNPNHLLPASLCQKPERRVTRLLPETQPQKDRDGCTHSPIKRSWSVFTPRGVLLQSTQPLSKHFDHMVSVHGLHLQQRAKWVISEHNCGASQDVEQVWRTLTRSARSPRLPTCNANIQRDRAEIWVFCDVLYSEQVGRFLKEELQLSGRISLSVHRLGNIFSM